jgi:hypothetical protein
MFRKPGVPTPLPPHIRHPTTSPHRSPPPFPTARLKSSPSRSVWGFWPQPPSPASCFANAPPHHHQCLIHTTIFPHLRALLFPTARPKLSPSSLVLGFWPQPPLCLAFREHTTPPPPISHIHHPTTFHHCPPLLFPPAHPRPSPSGSISGFRPKSPPPSFATKCSTHHCRYLFPRSPSTPFIAHHSCFQQRT